MIDYEHPHAEKILQESLKILENSETAVKLKEKLDESPYKIHIIKRSQARPFVPNNKEVYIGVPSTFKYKDMEHVIDISAAMIELDIFRSGYEPPLEEPESEQRRLIQHLKNLEVILQNFVIVEELENAGYKAQLSIRKNGLGKLYKAWQKNAEYKEFINIYWDMFK